MIWLLASLRFMIELFSSLRFMIDLLAAEQTAKYLYTFVYADGKKTLADGKKTRANDADRKL